MIRAHFYHTQEAVLEGITQQLFKHIDTTRFIADPHHSCDDFFYQGVFLHQEGVQFALALSGGETTRKLFTHWRKQHLSNQAWNSIDYYWIDECHTPYINKESNFGEAYRRFFQHSNINPSRIHPIHYTPQPQEEIERYASQLPHSRGLYYDPTRYYTNDYPCIAPYQSHFHCAILDIDDNGQITPLLNNTTTPVVYEETAKNNIPENSEEKDIENNKLISVLAYLGLFVLIPIFAAKDSPFARFHSNQGLVLLLAGVILTFIYPVFYLFFFVSLMFTGARISGMIFVLITAIFLILIAVMFILTILGIVNALTGKKKPLPLIGRITILK